MQKFQKSLGLAVKSLRVSSGLKQIAFSKKIKVSQGSLSKIESGQNMPSTATLLRLAQSTRTPISIILANDPHRSVSNYLGGSKKKTH